jgi:2-methylcitrate dehydratase PrpD
LIYFGAAAGAGRVLGLAAAQMRSALGLALMQVAGSRQVVLTGDPPAKAIYGAFPNQAGVLAALLSKAGLGADCDVIGEPAGLYPMIYDGACDSEAITKDLGSDFQLKAVEFKLWPTSNHVHPFVEAACSVPHLDASSIAVVEILAPSKLRPWFEPLDKRQRPENSAAAANSIPFCVAKSLAHGNVKLTDFTPAGLRDAAALSIASRTAYRLHDAVKGAIVRVRTANGDWHQAAVETPLGHRSRPASREQVVEKFRDCCRHAAQPMKPDTVEAIIEMIDDLPNLDNVSRLAALAGGGTTPAAP